MKQWQRYRNPNATPAPSPVDAAPDPTLQLLQRLSGALASGALTHADHGRLVGLFLDGRELEVAAELERATNDAGGRGV